jgi:hypothetical protein
MNYKEGGYKVTKEEAVNYDLKIQEAVSQSIKDLREKCNEEVFDGILDIILNSGKYVKDGEGLYKSVAMYIPDISKENIAQLKNDADMRYYDMTKLGNNIKEVISFRLGLKDHFTKYVLGNNVEKNGYLNTFIKETEKQIKKELGIEESKCIVM